MFKTDIHTHSLASGHAFCTVYELAGAAAAKGIKMIALTDHGPAMSGAPNPKYFTMRSRLEKYISGVRVLFGCEANIIGHDGTLDLPEEYRCDLDILIAGIHDDTGYPSGSGITENTNAIIAAIKKNKINCISHPWRPEFQIDSRRVAMAASEAGVMLEINLSLFKGGQEEERLIEETKIMSDIILSYGPGIIMTSDAHAASEAGDFHKAPGILEKLGISERAIAAAEEKLLNRFI